MKKFKFALDSLRRYRNTLFEQEQARLEALLHEFRKLEQRRVALLAEVEQGRQRIQGMTVIAVEELTAFQAFQRYAGQEGKRIGQERAVLAGRIDEQRLAVMLARRNVESLEKLKERRLESWRQEADRELEVTVAELVIARFKSSAGT